MTNAVTQSILVVGGGMSGMTAALEAAEAGHEVYLVEKAASLGGRVSQFHHYFPKMCPPYCGLEINFRRIKNLQNIRVFTLAEVERVSGRAGDFDVALRLDPRYVNEKCTCCGKCGEACALEIPDPYNYGMCQAKAARLPHDLAFPQRFVLDPALVASAEAQKVAESCPYGAIELDMKAKTLDLKVGAIVWATGWKPYDAGKLETYGFGKHANVLTNVMFERLAAATGPTGGKIVRPSDGKAPAHVAFIQCAGSRDINHLPFCSSICCLASMKQATYVREQLPEAKMTVFFIDIRATDRLEDLYTAAKADPMTTFFKGKVAEIIEDPATKNLVCKVEDTTSGTIHEVAADMVVLATGMQPNTADSPVPLPVAFDEYGFIQNGTAGIFACGCTRTPTGVSEAVQDGTAAALKAIQAISRR